MPCAVSDTVFNFTVTTAAANFGIPFVPVTTFRAFMKFRTAFLAVDMIPHYLVKAIILVILIVCVHHTALGAGMLAIS